MSDAVSELRPEFVEYVPDKLEAGVLYVTVKYATAVHLCCCGCDHEVVTPFSPTDWKLIFDGETVSLRPSIGNWSFPCRSHYWIRRNVIEWAGVWSEDRIEVGRRHDRAAKDRHLTNQPEVAPVPEVGGVVQLHTESPMTRPGLWIRIVNWLTNGWRR